MSKKTVEILADWIVEDHINVNDPWTRNEMEASFGPNWTQVIALIRQAATLTDKQARQVDKAYSRANLCGARRPIIFAARAYARDRNNARLQKVGAYNGPEWGPAWDAERGAACGAAGDAMLHNAGTAAEYAAAGTVAVDAAREASWAVAVSGLLGIHGLETRHVETLLGPWIAVVGDPRLVADVRLADLETEHRELLKGSDDV